MKMNDFEISYVTVAQAAVIVNRSPRWIQKLIQRGDLQAQKITARLYLVDINDVRAVIAASAERVGYPKGKPRGKTKSDFDAQSE